VPFLFHVDPSILLCQFATLSPPINTWGTTTESFADTDVSADGSYEGFTVAFEDDYLGDEYPIMPSETDQDRLTYLQDVFEGSNDIVTAWKSSSSFCQRIDNNGAENRLFHSIKANIAPILNISSQLVHQPLHAMTPAHFASIYLNRDWNLLMMDYVNDRIENLENKATPQDILEMQRVWILQCIYSTATKNLFNDGSLWYRPIRSINIIYDRYSFLFNALGSDVAHQAFGVLEQRTLGVTIGPADDHDREVLPQIWGSFNQYNAIIGKMETHIGKVGGHFLLERITDVTIDDDKLRHISKTFAGQCPSFYQD
jgi:hypothetical protein